MVKKGKNQKKPQQLLDEGFLLWIFRDIPWNINTQLLCKILKELIISDSAKLRFDWDKYSDIEISKKSKDAIKLTLEFYSALGGDLYK